MRAYWRIVSRLMLLLVLVMTAVALQAADGCFICKAQCRTAERDCETGCFDPGCFNNCANEYTICIEECGC